jgi:hypothetical protein
MHTRLTSRARRALGAIALALTAAPVSAGTITVDSLADTIGGPECTLRDAIRAAHEDAVAGGCIAGSGADTITFAVSGTVALARTLIISAGSVVTVDGSGQTVTISGRQSESVGEALMQVRPSATLHLRRVTVTEAHGARGGVVNLGTLTVNDCTFSGNNADFGAGIMNDGLLTVANSTFVGNSAISGGAILNVNHGVATVINSTITGNTATRSGGGIDNSARLVVLNSTVYGNAGIGITYTGKEQVLGNTIVANNIPIDCYSSADSSFSLIGTNVIADGSCAFQGALTGDPMLGPLTDNGGPTLTHALRAGSPAIDAGDNPTCATWPTDQRGSPRLVDGNLDGSAVCDLGAYEYSQLFAFSGFLAPVDNLPTINEVKAGRAVPVTFSLDGYFGLTILAPNSPSSQKVTCDSGAPVSDVEQTVAAGSSGLSYDAASDTYTYVWKTDKTWAGSCRQLVVQLSDGTFHLASFRIK